MVYKIFSILFSFFVLVSPAFAQQDTPVPVPAKQGSDISLNPLKETTRIGSYETLARLPGLPAVIDPGLEKGDAGAFTLPEYIKVLVRIAIGVIGILAVVMIVISGVQYMGSAMVTEKEGAKQRLTGAVLGLILAVSSVLLLRTINPQLTTLKIGDDKFQGGVDGVAAQLKIPEALLIEYSNSKGSGTNINIGEATGASAELGEKTIKERCGDLTTINNLDAVFKSAAGQAGISCNLLKATYVLESSCGKNLSSKGNTAVGILQQEMSAVNEVNQTFKKNYTSSDRSDKQKAAEIGAYYHKFIQAAGCDTKSKTNVCDASQAKYALAAYNGGPGTNKQSTDCTDPQTRWECSINRGGYEITHKYAIGGTSILLYLNKSNTGC